MEMMRAKKLATRSSSPRLQIGPLPSQIMSQIESLSLLHDLIVEGVAVAVVATVAVAAVGMVNLRLIPQTQVVYLVEIQSRSVHRTHK